MEPKTSDRAKSNLRPLGLAAILAVLLHAGLFALLRHWPGEGSLELATRATPTPRIVVTQIVHTPQPLPPSIKATSGNLIRATHHAGLDIEHYFDASELTRHPAPLQEIVLADLAPELTGSEGRMELSLWIDTSGKVVRSSIDQSDFSMTDSALLERLFASQRYAPGERNGIAVPSLFRIEIDANSIQPTDSQSTP